MPLTYKDVEMLQQSLAGLGQSLAQQRKEQEEQRRYETQLGMEREKLGLEAQRYATEQGVRETTATARLTESQARLQEMTERMKKNASDMYRQNFHEIANAVEKGFISPEAGTQMVKNAAGKIPKELADDPAISVMTSPDFQFTKTSTAPVEAKTSTGDVYVFNPKTGAFQFPKKPETTEYQYTVPATPETPAKPAYQPGVIAGLFGAQPTPATPAVPGAPEIKVKQKVPVGTPFTPITGIGAAPSSGATMPTPATPAKTGVRVRNKKTGKEQIYKGDKSDIPLDQYDILD